MRKLAAADRSMSYEWLQVHRNTRDEPERRLMMALLVDQVRIAAMQPRKTSSTSVLYLNSEILSARRWIRSDEEKWLFSFRMICDIIGLNADLVRKVVLNGDKNFWHRLRASEWSRPRCPYKIQKWKHQD